jgi:hypothetical protein
MPQTSLNTWSCLACKRRKVRCDRKSPTCANCVRRGTDCNFPTSGRVPRRPDRNAHLSPDAEPWQRAEAVEKLRRLESLLERHIPIYDRTSTDVDLLTSNTIKASSEQTTDTILKSQAVTKTLRAKRSRTSEEQPVLEYSEPPDSHGTFWSTVRNEVGTPRRVPRCSALLTDDRFDPYVT